MPGIEERTARRRVRGMLQAVADDVANLPAEALRSLYPALVEAEKETARALAAWLENVEDGSDRFTAHQYRKVLAQLRTVRKAALRRVRKEPEWTKEVEEAMHEGLRSASQRGGELATRHIHDELATFSGVFGHSLGLIPLEQAAIMARGEEALVPRFRASAHRYAGAVWKDMKRQFAIGVARNETIDQLTNRMRRLGGPKGWVATRGVAGEPESREEYIAEGLFRRYRHWAERVARTECLHGYNVHAEGGIAEAKAIDEGIKRRWDATLDSRRCLTCQGLHGEVVEVGEAFSDGSRHPPAHPNCFPGTVAVSGKAEAGLCAYYKGPLVELETAGGLVLAVTPNHRVAMPAGFAPASTIQEGDQVLCDRSEVWRPGSTGERSPPIHDVFRTLLANRPHVRVVASDENLHGDGTFCNGDICVVGADDGISVGIHPGPLEPLLFGPTADLSTTLAEVAGESVSADRRFIVELLNEGQVVPDRITKIRNIEFSGYVYDLQSPHGWIVAQGIVTSNCRCAVVAWHDDWKEDYEEPTAGEMMRPLGGAGAEGQMSPEQRRAAKREAVRRHRAKKLAEQFAKRKLPPVPGKPPVKPLLPPKPGLPVPGETKEERRKRLKREASARYRAKKAKEKAKRAKKPVKPKKPKSKRPPMIPGELKEDRRKRLRKEAAERRKTKLIVAKAKKEAAEEKLEAKKRAIIEKTRAKAKAKQQKELEEQQESPPGAAFIKDVTWTDEDARTVLSVKNDLLTLARGKIEEDFASRYTLQKQGKPGGTMSIKEMNGTFGQRWSSGNIEIAPGQVAKARDLAAIMSSKKKRDRFREWGDLVTQKTDIKRELRGDFFWKEKNKKRRIKILVDNARRVARIDAELGGYKDKERFVEIEARLIKITYDDPGRASPALEAERVALRKEKNGLKKRRKFTAAEIVTFKRADALTDGMRTIYHESLHSMGADIDGGGTGSGYASSVIEEVTTELCARAEVHRIWGGTIKKEGGTYGMRYIDPIAELLAERLRITPVEAFNVLTEMSQAYKTLRTSKVYFREGGERVALEKFSELLPERFDLDEKTSATVRKALRGKLIILRNKDRKGSLRWGF